MKPENLLSSPNPKDITHRTLTEQLMSIVPDISSFEESRNLAAADRATRALGEFMQNVHLYKKHLTSVKQNIRKSVREKNQ